MRIFVTGGTGLIGKALIEKLIEQKCQITVLTRDVNKAIDILGNQVEFCKTLDSLTNFDGYNAVINLAGAPIAEKRWTVKQKENLCESRWAITWQLSSLVRATKIPPDVFISGSAVGYYGSYDDVVLTENKKSHEGFTHLLCEKWENLALEAQNRMTRVCLLRTGIVLSTDGGVLSKMAIPFKYFAGSVLGKGDQYISWIHIDDMVAAILFLLYAPNAQGAFNLTAPNPVTNNVFSHELAKALHRPCLFRVPPFVLKLLLGEASTMVLDGQRAVPQKLLNLGFIFKYDKIEKALNTFYKSK